MFLCFTLFIFHLLANEEIYSPFGNQMKEIKLTQGYVALVDDTPEEAAKKYNEFAMRLHGQFASLNQI